MEIVISILFVAKSDENAFQSRTKHFSGLEWARLASGLKFERSENFKKPIGPTRVQKKCFVRD